jgi:hypothetical protein
MFQQALEWKKGQRRLTQLAGHHILRLTITATPTAFLGSELLHIFLLEKCCLFYIYSL